MNPLMRRARGLVGLVVLLLVAALSACTGSLLESKVAEPQVYVLHNGGVPTASVAYPIQLSIALPSAAPGLDTTRIAVLRNGNQLDYYYGARWGGTAPQVLQTFLVSYLQRSQGFKSVVSEDARIDADYLLDVQLQDFQAEYADAATAPTIHVALVAQLIDIKARKTIATLNAQASVTATENRLSAAITAFQTAAQQATAALAQQLTVALSQPN